MCKAIQDIREDGKKEGVQEGVLLSIKNLMETMNLTPQRAMDALLVPETDRAGYLAKLTQ